MSGIEFEKFLERLFSAMGYLVAVTKATGDQGADLVIEKSGEKTAVQAKSYADKVGNYAVQEVLAAKPMYKAHRAMVVTNNYFTDAAKSLGSVPGGIRSPGMWGLIAVNHSRLARNRGDITPPVENGTGHLPRGVSTSMELSWMWSTVEENPVMCLS